MCVFDGKTWVFGRMLGHSVSDLKLEQTLYALWITNNTEMGQGKNRGRKEEMHTSQMYLRYTMDTPTGRMKKFTVIAAATVMRRIKVRMKMTWFHLQTSLFSNNNTAIMI